LELAKVPKTAEDGSVQSTVKEWKKMQLTSSGKGERKMKQKEMQKFKKKADKKVKKTAAKLLREFPELKRLPDEYIEYMAMCLSLEEILKRR